MNQITSIATDTKSVTTLELVQRDANGKLMGVRRHTLTKTDVALLVEHLLDIHAVKLVPKAVRIHTTRTGLNQ